MQQTTTDVDQVKVATQQTAIDVDQVKIAAQQAIIDIDQVKVMLEVQPPHGATQPDRAVKTHTSPMP